MKNKINVKSNSGITLMTLVITIIVLLILASVATYSGIEAIDNTKMTAFTAELKIMQTHVNELYDKYTNGGSVTITDDEENTITYTGKHTINSDGTTILGIEDIGENLNEEKEIFVLDKCGTTDFKYYSNKLIQKLGIEGTKQSFFVNIPKRIVVSEKGLKYKGNMYYTLNELPDGFYNVEYKDKNTEKPQIGSVNITSLDDYSWKFMVNNITYGGYVNKGKVLYKKDGTTTWQETENDYFIVKEAGKYNVKVVDSAGNESTVETKETNPADEPECWQKVYNPDPSQWYSYGGAKVNSPKLKGNMTPIEYIGEVAPESNTTNKWANAITSDGSMFVWIPRYAYKITYSGSDRSAGTIDVAFVDTNNKPLNNENIDSEDITANPATDGAGTTKWLVHPAFVNDSANNFTNGGWDSELSGIWVGKFEATGTYSEDDDGNVTSTSILSVKPGTLPLVSMTINQQYKFAQTGTFGETVTLNSHMAKNSEWGAMVYLAYSKYGRNGGDVAKNGSQTTGGNDTQSNIYSTNYGQSTTNNPYGVYDLRGGSYEYVASYVNYSSGSFSNGGTESGDLYESNTSTSTRYKTVYQASGTSTSASYNLLDSKNKIRGDAIFETSTSYSGSTSWNNGTGNSVYSGFPSASSPFFGRGGGCNSSYPGVFYFINVNGGAASGNSFRVVLCP